MAAKEQTIQEKLKQLYSLQVIDSKIDEIKIMKGELPMEVRDLEDDVAGLELRKKKSKEAITEIEQEISRHTANIAQCEALIARYEKQLDEVKNNREFDALNKEIELQKLEIQLSQKRIRENGAQKDSKTEAFNIISARLDGRKKDLAAKKEELSSIIEKTDIEEDELHKKSEVAREHIEPRLLKAYDKIRKAYRNGLAVVPINREACGGCFNKIPPQVQIEIGVMKNIIACEHCGRVLIDEVLIHEVVGV